MRRMGIEALYRRPRTSIPARGAAIYPYLLSGLAIERPNQVWASDITYLPMAHGFMYLVAILDVASRKVLSFRLSNTLTADFCVEALEEAMLKFGRPEIFNTDQGSQFTSEEWIKRPEGRRRRDQHGRQGSLDRQRVHRAAVAEREVRRGLPARLHERHRSAQRLDPVLQLLQRGSPAPVPRVPHAR